MSNQLARFVVAALVFVHAGTVVAQDAVFKDSFEQSPVPEIARFLTQATFGPSPDSVAHLRSLGAGTPGMEAWIDEQLALPPTLVRPYLLQRNNPGQGHRLDRWFHTAATAPDQLRQRVAFALSQILVLSDASDNLTNEWEGIAEYHDILARGAFGSYRALLEDVAKSPQMGRYLSHWRNRKKTATTQPDENFAREIMQLFSIGLVERKPDYTPVLDADQQVIPTYDQKTVSEMARVFTGLGTRCGEDDGTCSRYGGLTWTYDGVDSMACFPKYHDNEAKELLGVPLPAGPACGDTPPADPAVLAQCFSYCESDIDAALDVLASHPNVAPFLAHQLIQRLVTSNPSSAYVARVADAFNQSDGNLGATVRALLLDPEARAYDPRQPGFAQPANFGKLREPLLRVTAVWRAFGAVAGNCSADCPDGARMGLRSPQTAFAQRPLGAPSVFNFYEPDYKHPGVIADLGLDSPEFQILNETTAVSSANELWYVAWSGYNSYDTTFQTPSESAYFPEPEIDMLPSDPGALIEELNLRLMYGSMSGAFSTGECAPAGTGMKGSGMKGALYQLLGCEMNGANMRQKALGAIHLIAISPEFNVQR